VAFDARGMHEAALWCVGEDCDRPRLTSCVYAVVPSEWWGIGMLSLSLSWDSSYENVSLKDRLSFWD
jgi:hypothetical protein